MAIMLKQLTTSIGSIGISSFRSQSQFIFRTLATVSEPLSADIQTRIAALTQKLPDALKKQYAEEKPKKKRYLPSSLKTLKNTKESGKDVEPKWEKAVKLEHKVFAPLYPRKFTKINFINKFTHTFGKGELSEEEAKYWSTNYERFLSLYEVFTPKPKKPLGPFLRFSAEKRGKGSSLAEMGEIQKQLSKEWGQLSDDEKKLYAPSLIELEKFEEDLQEWKDRRLVEYATFEKNVEEFELDPPLNSL